MARIEATVADIEDVPEQLREYYAQNAHGEWTVAISGLEDHPQVRGAVRAMNASKEQRDELRAQLARWSPVIEAIGEDEEPDAVAEWLRGRGEETQAPVDEELSKLRTEAAKARAEAAKLQKEIVAREKAEGMYLGRIREQMGKDLVYQLDKVGVAPEDREVVAAYLQSKGLDLDSDLQPVFRTDIHGVPEANQPMADYVAEWAQTEAAARYIRSSGASGSGAPPRNAGGGGGSGPRTFTREQLRAGAPEGALEAIAQGKAVVTD